MPSSPHIIALMYHRIDATDTDPWNICVSSLQFEKQIRFIKNSFNVISVSNAIEQVATGNIVQNSVCITFDDGYADNYLHAKPILEKYNCPATFFIATAFINQQCFWWDELEMILLHSKQLPDNLCLKIEDKSYQYTIKETELTTEQWQQHINWKWYETPPTSRCTMFLDIWEKLRALSHEQIRIQINAINKWAGSKNNYTYRLPINTQQLRELSQHPLFSIGLHTHTHIDLNAKPKSVQLKEILRCKELLMDNFNIESNCLSYPYGRFDDTTIESVKELGITACFTTEAKVINSDTDLYKLGRIQVCDWGCEQLKEVIREVK